MLLEKLGWETVIEALADAMGTADVGVTLEKYPNVRQGTQVLVPLHLIGPKRGCNLAKTAPSFQRQMPGGGLAVSHQQPPPPDGEQVPPWILKEGPGPPHCSHHSYAGRFDWAPLCKM